ncbi:patatin-like phospholipase family protein [Cellulophaga baltica]|uniref:patatin-like phospholipase family protein n=1 Tax=Cellulophaga baltica TaxID=76594 RepID=UPI0015F611F4|nr:patatin-like phospholipase family protein [Cellulophaga baltica]MBA6313777.1 patatin-like phospholipase family protein [Cellulophaga baltica]
MTKELSSNQSIGLVLSGGGVRGMAHIGLIKAMKEFDIEAKYVTGSSVGALVGALYANGNSIDDMLSFFKTTPLFNYQFLTIAKAGFMDTDKYIRFFKAYFPEDTFEALEKELHIVATNIQDGDAEFFSTGELIRPLLASAALPPVFSPIEINGQLYADGGIMNNFPSEPLYDKCDYIIGSNVSIVSKLEKKDLKNSYQLTGRVTGLMIYAASKAKLKSCNLLFESSELEHIGMLDRKAIEKAYTLGYDHACRQFEALVKA